MRTDGSITHAEKKTLLIVKSEFQEKLTNKNAQNTFKVDRRNSYNITYVRTCARLRILRENRLGFHIIM